MLAAVLVTAVISVSLFLLTFAVERVVAPWIKNGTAWLSETACVDGLSKGSPVRGGTVSRRRLVHRRAG